MASSLIVYQHLLKKCDNGDCSGDALPSEGVINNGGYSRDIFICK
jgi:hypothetical protein